MTYNGGSPFGSSPSGGGQDGPFGSSPRNSHGDRATDQSSPSASAPFSGGAASPPPSVKPTRQSSGVTVAWIAAALALVVGLGSGGAAAVNALTGAAPSAPDASGAPVIDDNAERAEIYRNASDRQFLAGDVGALMPDSLFVEEEEEIVYRDTGGPVWAQDPGTEAWYAVGVTGFGEETDATSAGATVIAPPVAAIDFAALIHGPA